MRFGAFFRPQAAYGVGVKLGISLDPDRREALFWRLQALGWGGTLVTSAMMTSYLSLENGITLSFFRTVFAVVVSAFLLRPIYRAMRTSRPVVTPLRIVTIFALCVTLGVADTVSTLGLVSVLGVNRVMEGLREVFIVSTLMRFALYAFWSVLYFGILSLLDAQQEQLRAARTEAALRSGELQMLRSQVNPHFLFNSLNSLLAASDDPPIVRRLTLALTDYLRFSLQQRGDFERLGVELAALQSYLQVEKVRFEENFEYAIETGPGVIDVKAPVALIQPVLENAIKYGQLSAIRPLRIEIRTAIEDGALVVTVTNSGYWVEPGTHSSTGIGLANLRRRLQLLYGDRASIALEPAGASVTARILVPSTPRRHDDSHQDPPRRR